MINSSSTVRFTLDSQGDWLSQAKHCLSPYFDDRPHNSQQKDEDTSVEQYISLLVIHCISLPEGVYGTGYPQALFLGELRADEHPDIAPEISVLNVSAHILIERDGNVTQFVPLSKRAWHAGDSCFDGKTCCNDFSIGIELEGSEHEHFAPVQYQILNALIKIIRQRYPLITPDNIVGHSDIAPGRKTDPGEFFNWQLVRKQLNFSSTDKIIG